MKWQISTALASMLLWLPAALADEHTTEIGEGIHEVPLFDAHIHYKRPAWGKYPVENIIELMDRNGVAMGLVSSTPDEGTIKLWEYAPNRIVPELRPYHAQINSLSWINAPKIDDYLEKRLEKYPHEGIGEFHIHKLNKQEAPFFRKVIQLAKANDIFLHVHSGDEAIRWLYSLDPDVKIIWAHAGLSTNSLDVYQLMAEFPDLVADTSLREWAILNGVDGKLNEQWEKIIVDFQDRLMIGSDTWINEQWDRYDEIMDSNKQWLSKLPRSIAEKIAYKNAERLYNRKIDMSLIGKR